jgi:guanylate kinase
VEKVTTLVYSVHMEIDDSLKAKVASYQPSAKVLELLGKTKILLLVAISGAGKDTVKHHLLQTGQYHHIISHTTRAPRTNDGVMERDGADYHFIGLAAADKMLDSDAYIEADVYAGNIYGTSVGEIRQAFEEDKIATTDVTIQGAEDYLGLAPNAKVVFLLPPSYDVWVERLMARYHGKPPQAHDLYLRMTTAIDEIEKAISSDKYYIVINDDLNDTVELVDEIAHGAHVEPHYHKAVKIAEEIIRRIRGELAKAS